MSCTKIYIYLYIYFYIKSFASLGKTFHYSFVYYINRNRILHITPLANSVFCVNRLTTPPYCDDTSFNIYGVFNSSFVFTGLLSSALHTFIQRKFIQNHSFDSFAACDRYPHSTSMFTEASSPSGAARAHIFLDTVIRGHEC